MIRRILTCLFWPCPLLSAAHRGVPALVVDHHRPPGQLAADQQYVLSVAASVPEATIHVMAARTKLALPGPSLVESGAIGCRHLDPRRSRRLGQPVRINALCP
jgi:hypothetical protein